MYIVRPFAGSWGRSLLTNSPSGKNYLLSPPPSVSFLFQFSFRCTLRALKLCDLIVGNAVEFVIYGEFGGYFGPRIP